MLNYNPPGVIIPLEWLDLFEKMPGELVKSTVLAILSYAATGALPEFTDPTLDVLWPIFQARLDSDRERYQKKVERSRAYKERQAAQADAPTPRKTASARTSPTFSAQPLSQREAAINKWL